MNVDLYIYAYKKASLPKGYTGGKVHWNPWIGEYRTHPSDNDLEALSKLPEGKYQKMRDKVVDNDLWAREDAALRRSMHWKPLSYIPLPAIAVPTVAAVDAKTSQKAESNPEYEEARRLLHEQYSLDPKRVSKYQDKIDKLVAALRAQRNNNA